MDASHIATAVTFAALGAALWQAWVTHLTRRDKQKPNILVYLRPGARHFQILEMVFANVGEGAARNIWIKSHLAKTPRDEANLGHRNFLIPGMTAVPNIAGLPAGKEIAFPLGMTNQILKFDDDFWPISATLDVEDMEGIHLSSSVFHLDGRELKKFNKTGDAAINDIATSLNALIELLKSITQNGRRLKVEAQIETRKEAEEQTLRRYQELEEQDESSA